MQEIWKDIVGYEGKYQVSSLGNIKSLNYKRSKKEHNLSPIKNVDGYLIVSLCKNSTYKNLRVNRLVGQAFLGLDITDLNILVCHRNDVRSDNRLENLFLGTNKDNSIDMVKKGRHPSTGKFGKNNSNSKEVLQIDLDGNIIAKFGSTMDVERKFGYYNSNISLCCRGKAKTAFGYNWEYTY